MELFLSILLIAAFIRVVYWSLKKLNDTKGLKPFIDEPQNNKTWKNM